MSPLLTCRECGKGVSSEAPACPHCGVPRPAAAERNSRPPWIGMLFVLLMTGLVLWGASRAGRGQRSGSRPVQQGDGGAVPQESATLTGCDFQLADDPLSMASGAVATVNLWNSVEGEGIVATARGLDESEPRGTPGWCVGEAVSVLDERVDHRGRRRLLVRTGSGGEGWVTDFFVLR